jgi:hypothetical protein
MGLDSARRWLRRDDGAAELLKMWRLGGLLFAFALIGLTVVYLRAEQTRVAAQTLELEGEWVSLRRELWDAEAHVARLRTPARVHQRLDLFDVDVVEDQHGAAAGGEQVAARTSSDHG